MIAFLAICWAARLFTTEYVPFITEASKAVGYFWREREKRKKRKENKIK